jgi:uncharacterized membrane protein
MGWSVYQKRNVMSILFSLIAIVLSIFALRRARIHSENFTQRLTELEVEVYRLRSKPGPTQPAEPKTVPLAKAPQPAGQPFFVPVPEMQPDATFPAPPLIPAMPVRPETEEIAPGVFGEPNVPPAAAPAPAIAPPPSPAFARILEMRAAAADAEPRPPFVSAQTESVPPDEPPPAAEKASFEMRLGTYWLVRAGIIMLLTGLAFFGNYAYHNIVGKLGPGGKISLLYLASGLLLGAGAWWQRRAAKESLKNYAQVLFAGGLAAVYFTTYAAHHIPPLCVITSAVVDGTLLLAWAGVIAWLADRRKSEVMAFFAVGLAFYSSVITRVGDFTLYSNLVLTLAAVGFLLRNRWVSLSFAGLATSYAGYAFWRFLHDDGWRWAMPDERLNFGAAFLLSYWLIFTAATFLSRSEKLHDKNRAAFLTLNNGAFFALFLLTMLEVHRGGFWKFSLGYGAALLALAGLCKIMLPAEPPARNAYLTQGLLLVTLGFISKFAGLQLALVLGVESVVLFLTGTQRSSGILKFFAYAAALLATGWCVVSLSPFAPHGLWTALALGGFMAVNAARAHWLEAEKDPPSPRLETTAFTLLAFVSWTAAAWFNTPEPHLFVALVLGAESVVLFNLVARRQSPVPKLFAYLVAVLAVGGCAANLKQFDSSDLWTGAALGVLMIFNAYWAHRETLEDNDQPLRAEPSMFTLLAFACWLAVTWYNTTAGHLPLVLAAEAVALTLSIYVLRVREITLLGQFFLVLAQFAWLFHFLNATPPWWNPLALITVTVGLSHWWQRQKRVTVSESTFTCYSTVFALAAIAIVIVWLHPLVSAPAWLVLTSLLAVVVTLYGVVTRAWPLAVCGQIFLGVSAWEFFTQVWMQKPEWFFPLAPMAVLGMLSLATVGWFAGRPDRAAEVRDPLLTVALIYRWTALAMSLCWLWQYVPDRQHVGAFMGAALGVFLFALWKRSREALAGAAVYASVSLATLWLREDLQMDVYWLNGLALLALLVMQQILRRLPDRFLLDEQIHGAVVFAAGVSLWRLASCWAGTFTGGFFITMIWAGLALLVFAAGMILRERCHRWLGLGVLAVAVGRVVLVDVWKQETIYRVLTFMALGVALLVIGFIYNKYQEAIRKWL